MWRNILLLTFGSLALMLGIGYFTADPQKLNTPDADKVMLVFDQIAFSGFGEEGPTGTGPYLRRWTGPVQIALVGAPDEDGETVPWGTAVGDLVKVYDSLRGLEVAITAEVPYQAGPTDHANLEIVTVPTAEMETVMDQLPPKLAGTLGNSRGGCVVLGADAATLTKVTILMAGSLSQSRRATCLGESLATALGYTIEAKHSSDVFRARQGQISFHGQGRLAAELVYNSALEPGMPRDVARAKAAEILQEQGLKNGG